MGPVLALLYGVFCYVVFFLTFLYAIGFLGNIVVPKTVDYGASAPLAEAIIVNVFLLSLFAVQHSTMARPAFKRWWTRFVPPVVERSTYVLIASLILTLLYWLWRPMPETVWTIADPFGAAGMTALFWIGWAIVLLSTFLIDHFELFGLKQVVWGFRKQERPAPAFKTPLLYRRIRHPLYLGFLIAFWATPTMSAGHLLFAAVMSGYILVGIWFEERDLIGVFGDRYRRYREEAGMLLPWRKGAPERR